MQERKRKERIRRCNEDILEAAFAVKQRTHCPVAHNVQQEYAEALEDKRNYVENFVVA